MARVLLVALMVAVFACAPLALAQNTPQAAPAQPDFSKVTIKADLQNYRTPLIEARDRIAKLIKQGKTIDAAVAAKPLADLDAKMDGNQQGSDNFVKRVYLSCKPAAKV